MVDRRGLEPRIPLVKGDVLPVKLRPREADGTRTRISFALERSNPRLHHGTELVACYPSLKLAGNNAAQVSQNRLHAIEAMRE